jgi:hypothetical protein
MPRQTARFGIRVGSHLGAYRIVDELGEGGMGRVYLAEHVLLGRRAAIKVLLPHLTHVPDIVQRFFNEARATTRVRHPGIVEIYDYGTTEQGLTYIVMELLEGMNLGDRMLQKRRLPLLTALVIARRIASALAAAHEVGIIHRDLKPDNVFLIRDPEGSDVDQVKILDFGIAKLVADGLSKASVTTSGIVMGTPLYMSPEQCRGAGECDARSDLYSVGCVLFELIAGRPPFIGQGGGEVIAAHLNTPPPSLRGIDPLVPAPVDLLVQRLLAKDPAARPASATVLVAELDRRIDDHAPGRRVAAQPTVLAGEVPAVRTRGRGAGLAVAVLGIAAIVTGLWLWRGPEEVTTEPPAPPPRPPQPKRPTMPPPAPTVTAAPLTAPPATPPPVDAAVTAPTVLADAGVEPPKRTRSGKRPKPPAAEEPAPPPKDWLEHTVAP